MKNIIKFIPYLVIITLSLAGVANAKSNKTELAEKSVNVKCYVELVGGGETISLWSIKPSLLKGFAHSIVGREILVISGLQRKSNNQKSTIYKAKECVLEEDDFTSARAKAIDKELPR